MGKITIFPRRRGLASVLAVAAVAVPLATASACLNGDEYRAFSVRNLQTELMVAALSCRQDNYKGRYNRFVRKFTKGMVAEGHQLKRAFRRHYGAQATQRMDRYLTVLANRLSKRSMAEPGFCDNSGELFDVVLRLDKSQLANFSLSRGVAVTEMRVCADVAQSPNSGS